MKELSDFLVLNSKKPKVVVQGLGFVGSVMALVCANSSKKDYAVIGVDLPNENGSRIIDMLNKGKFPVKADDPKIKELFKSSQKKKNFYATSNTDAFKYADIIIVDINLDVDKKNNFDGMLESYDVNMSKFSNAIESIGRKCSENALILIETTIPPGTCENIVKPIINNCLDERGLSTKKIKIGHSYERVMPGPNYIDSIINFYRVYSGVDKKSARATKKFLKTIISTEEYPLTKLKSTNATEMAKVLENSYRAMNIAFMVEWSRFAEEANVNLYDVIEAIKLRPTHSNMMFPGIGVGGYCLTKDALLASWSRQNLISKNNNPLNFSEKAINTNDQMPKFAFDYLSKYLGNLKSKNILLLGVSYRGDVGDTRYSPVEKMHDYLSELGCNIICHDPFVDFWSEKSLKIYDNLLNINTETFDIIMLCSAHSTYNDERTISDLIEIKPCLVYDTLGFFSEKNLKRLKTKHKILVLGRGDLKNND